MRLGSLPLVLLAAVLLVGCSASDDRAERAREDSRRALAAGDRSAMLGALEELRASQPDTPEAILELSALLVQATRLLPGMAAGTGLVALA